MHMWHLYQLILQQINKVLIIILSLEHKLCMFIWRGLTMSKFYLEVTEKLLFLLLPSIFKNPYQKSIKIKHMQRLTVQSLLMLCQGHSCSLWMIPVFLYLAYVTGTLTNSDVLQVLVCNKLGKFYSLLFGSVAKLLLSSTESLTNSNTFPTWTLAPGEEWTNAQKK